MTQLLRYPWAMCLTAIVIVTFVYLFFSKSTSQAKVLDDCFIYLQPFLEIPRFALLKS